MRGVDTEGWAAGWVEVNLLEIEDRLGRLTGRWSRRRGGERAVHGVGEAENNIATLQGALRRSPHLLPICRQKAWHMRRTAAALSGHLLEPSSCERGRERGRGVANGMK